MPAYVSVNWLFVHGFINTLYAYGEVSISSEKSPDRLFVCSKASEGIFVSSDSHNWWNDVIAN